MKMPNQSICGHSDFDADARPHPSSSGRDLTQARTAISSDDSDLGPAQGLIRAVVFGLAAWLVLVFMLRLLVL